MPQEKLYQQPEKDSVQYILVLFMDTPSFHLRKGITFCKFAYVVKRNFTRYKAPAFS